MTYSKNHQNSIKWIDPSLQALSFWIGYKRELYHNHLLNEGGLVTEFASLINSNLKQGEIVRCEEQYKKFISGINNNTRVDILILNNKQAQVVIEVKRYDAGKRHIEKDLLKLAYIKSLAPSLSVYLVIVAQGKKPNTYINDKGVSNKQYYQIGDTEYYSIAKRVCKSTSSFRPNSHMYSNYAILIEVLLKK